MIHKALYSRPFEKRLSILEFVSGIWKWGLIVFLLLPLWSLGAQISSKQDGNWSDGSTWNGGVVPGTGDTAIIQDGHTVTNDVKGQGIDVAGIDIESGGILDGQNKKMTIGSLWIVDGRYKTSNGAQDVNFTGGGGAELGRFGSWRGMLRCGVQLPWILPQR